MVDIFFADRGVDVVERQRAVGLVGHGVGLQPGQRRHAADFVQEDMRLIAHDDFVAALAVGEQRHQVAHAARGHKERGFVASHGSGHFL